MVGLIESRQDRDEPDGGPGGRGHEDGAVRLPRRGAGIVDVELDRAVDPHLGVDHVAGRGRLADGEGEPVGLSDVEIELTLDGRVAEVEHVALGRAGDHRHPVGQDRPTLDAVGPREVVAGRRGLPVVGLEDLRVDAAHEGRLRELDRGVHRVRAVAEDREGPVGDHAVGSEQSGGRPDHHLLARLVDEHRAQRSRPVAQRRGLPGQQHGTGAVVGAVEPSGHDEALVPGFGLDPALEGEATQPADLPDAGIGGGASRAGAGHPHAEVHLARDRRTDVEQVDGLARDGVEAGTVEGPQRRETGSVQGRGLGLAEDPLLEDPAYLALPQGTPPQAEVVDVDRAGRQPGRGHRADVERGRRVAGEEPDRLLRDHLAVEEDAGEALAPIDGQGHMMVVAGDQHPAEAGLGVPAPVLEDQGAGATGGDQTQREVGDAGMLGPDGHLHIGHRTGVVDLDRGDGARDIGEGGGTALEGAGELRGEVALAVDGGIEAEVHARGIVEEHEVGAGLQGGDIAHGDADDARPEQGRHAVVDIGVLGVGERLATDVDLEGQIGRDHVGDLDDQAAGVGRDDPQPEVVAAGSKAEILEHALIEGRQHLRLHLEIDRTEEATAAQDVVLEQVVPSAGTAEAGEVEERGARTVGGLPAGEAEAGDIIVEAEHRARDPRETRAEVANGPTVVDGDPESGVEQGALQVEEVVVDQGLAEGHVAGDARGAGAEVADHPRRVRTSVGDLPRTADRGHEQAVAVGPEDLERPVAAADDQFELAGLLVLGLDADVVHLAVGRGVGDLDALVGALEGGPVGRRQDRGLEVGEARVGGHVEVEVGAEDPVPQSDAGASRPARPGQVGGRGDHELDVSAIGQTGGGRRLGVEEVGEGEEVPLGGLARGPADQR